MIKVFTGSDEGKTILKINKFYKDTRCKITHITFYHELINLTTTPPSTSPECSAKITYTNKEKI